MVLSPGGGWVTNPGVIERLRPPGVLVHLRIAPAAALARLSKSRIVRPLLASPDPLARIEALWAQRAPLYNSADVTIDVESVEQQRLIESVAALARGGRQGIG
jgi:shikimate kinase